MWSFPTWRVRHRPYDWAFDDGAWGLQDPDDRPPPPWRRTRPEVVYGSTPRVDKIHERELDDEIEVLREIIDTLGEEALGHELVARELRHTSREPIVRQWHEERGAQLRTLQGIAQRLLDKVTSSTTT